MSAQSANSRAAHAEALWEWCDWRRRAVWLWINKAVWTRSLLSVELHSKTWGCLCLGFVAKTASSCHQGSSVDLRSMNVTFQNGAMGHLISAWRCPCAGTGFLVDSAFCYQKSCNSHDGQCREILVKAQSASPRCYKEINSQGNRFGHCGVNGTAYLKCPISDSFCGRVHCENGNIPHLGDHSDLQYTHINGVTCWSVDYHLEMSTPDVGEVKDGTMCGPGKICIHKKCVSLLLFCHSSACLRPVTWRGYATADITATAALVVLPYCLHREALEVALTVAHICQKSFLLIVVLWFVCFAFNL